MPHLNTPFRDVALQPDLKQGAFVQPHPRYQVLEKIASGSFATVYRGRDLELGREVAIKQIHQQYLEEPRQLDRYWQEAQLLASFQHPNIVTIYDIVRERGWLILELMQGNLAKVAGRKPLDLESLRSTLAHCLRALRFLHAHGIVHGDIKPSNLMIDRRKRIKIGDFGLARRVSDDDGSLIKGTTKYMAPEVVTDEFGDVGPASDLYSLGFVAYELLCGENFESLFPGLSAFGRDKQIAWMMWHAAPDRRLPEIRRTLEGVPEDLAKVIQKLIAKPQAERYHSADEALSDLKIDIKLVGGDVSQDGTMAPAADPAKKKRMIAIGAFAASFVLCLLVLLGDVFRSGSPEPPKGFTGLVREVRPEEKMLIVVDETGYPNEVRVPDETRFYLVDEQFTGLLKDVKPGDRIQPPRTSGDRRILDVLRPRETSGTISHVNVPQAEVEITVEEGVKRGAVVLRVPLVAKLQLNGKTAELADLQPEDRVKVEHLRDPKQQAARIVIALDALRTVREVGFVVKADDKRLIIEQKEGRNTNQLELPLAEGAPVKINGQDSPGGGKPAYAPADLKPGDRVVVLRDTHVTAVQASRRQSLSGVVDDLDPEKGVLQVLTSSGETHTFRCDEECEVSLAGDRVAVADLRRFDAVDITYDPEGTVSPARTVDAVRKPRGQRTALLIAVQNYDDRKLTRPRYPLVDARHLQEMLVKRYSVAPERVVVVADPTKADLERHVRDFLGRTTNQSQVLVTFSGNAYKAEDGTVYLATKDTTWDDLQRTGLKLEWLANEIDKSVAMERIFVFDGSHAGTGPDLQRQFSAEEMLKTLEPRGGGPLLKQTTVVGSTRHGERGQDWTEKGHSLFGWAVADAFTMKADTNRDTLVDPQELFSHLKSTMAEAEKELPSSQTPVAFTP